jgi:predicted nucleotidyltransferase
MIGSFRKVLEKVVSELAAMKEVESILFFGSVQQGQPTVASDLDLFVIVDGNETWNYKRIVDHVEVEVYFLPARLCKINIEKGDAIFVRAFSSGSPLLDKNGDLALLSELAKKVYQDGPKPLDSLQKSNIRIRLSEFIRDLEGLNPETPEAKMLSSILVISSIEAYYQINQIWPVKQSKMIRDLSIYNPQLGQKISRFYLFDMTPDLAMEICDDVLRSVGGRIREYQGPRVPI